MHISLQRQSGSTLLGFIIGLLVGLAIAVGVAVYISNAPLPFVAKVRPPSATPAQPAGAPLPDPNKSFNVSPPAPGAAPAPAPSSTPPAAPAASPEKAATAPAKEDALPEGSRFLLQVGAFKSPEDADGMRARLAMIGLDARVFPIEQSGQTLHRVRLGPYGQLDDVNRVRKLLADNGIEAQIVRLR